MHKIAIPQPAIDAVLRQRGKLHVYDQIEAGKCALLVIDLQNVFMLPGMPLEVPMAREIVPTVNRLAAAMRAAKGTVIWVQLNLEGEGQHWSVLFDYMLRPEQREGVIQSLSPGGDGHRLYDGLEVRPEDPIVQKKRFSAFVPGSSDLDALLRRRGIDTLVIAGTLTNVCCEASARDAMMLNYKVIFVADANATFDDATHNGTLANMLPLFADVMTTDEVIERLR